MKICDTKAENNYLNIQLPLNGNDFDEMLNDENYKKKINKLYDAGWKNIHLQIYDVYMFGHYVVFLSIHIP